MIVGSLNCAPQTGHVCRLLWTNELAVSSNFLLLGTCTPKNLPDFRVAGHCVVDPSCALWPRLLLNQPSIAEKAPSIRFRHHECRDDSAGVCRGGGICRRVVEGTAAVAHTPQQTDGCGVWHLHPVLSQPAHLASHGRVRGESRSADQPRRHLGPLARTSQDTEGSPRPLGRSDSAHRRHAA
jgi:hypothetical protein